MKQMLQKDAVGVGGEDGNGHVHDEFKIRNELVQE